MTPRWPEPDENLSSVVIAEWRGETRRVRRHMKSRWIGGLLLAALLSLAACTPSSEGGGSSAGPSQGAPAASEDDGGGRYDY